MRNLFIITDDGIFMGRERLHKNLADKLKIPHNHILHGGGVFDQRTKAEENKWILFGQSFDFGKYDEEMIQYFIDRNEVFWMKKPLGRWFDGVTFEIDHERTEKDSDAF